VDRLGLPLGAEEGARLGATLILGTSDGADDGIVDGTAVEHPQISANVGSRIVGQFGGEET